MQVTRSELGSCANREARYIVGRQISPILILGFFRMLAALKKSALGLALIVGAAAILLYSDLDSRRVQVHGKNRVLRVAVVQQISIPALDDGVTGALAGLKER